MKLFIKKVFTITLLIAVITICLDIVYTHVYTSSSPRTKNMIITSIKKEEFKNIFIGSSRVENTVNTKLSEKLSKEKTYNFGISGRGFAEYLLILEILLENDNKINNIYLQIDHINYTRTHANTKLTTVGFLPYINKSKSINNFFKKYDEEYFMLKYVPFYRYAINDSKLGFRELINTAIEKPLFTLENKGFYPLEGNKTQEQSYVLPKSINSDNLFLEELKEFYKKENINLYFFISPICNHSNKKEFVELLKTNITYLADFSGTVNEDKGFYDCGHLNSIGANQFTKSLFEYFKTNN